MTAYSRLAGTFKPDKRMYEDALTKGGFSAADALSVDESPVNLEGAARLGITPVLIAASPAQNVGLSYLKIHSLTELL